MFTILLAHFLLFIAHLHAHGGELLSICTRQTDCESPLICSPSSLTTTCPASALCRCHPAVPAVRLGNNLVPCENNDVCPPNHSCFTNPDRTSLACIAVSGDSEGVSVGVGESTGVTFDVCRSDENCIGGRKCRLIHNNDVTDCDDRPNCSCLSPEPVRCSSDDDCEDGEMCANTVAFGLICVSRSRVQNGGVDVMDDLPDIDQDDEQDDEPEEEHVDEDEPADSDKSPGKGTALVLEPCKTSTDCLPPRQCLDIVKEPDTICAENPTNQCVCGHLVIPPCIDDSDCAEGETCVPRKDAADDFCVSKSVMAASGGSGVGVNGSSTGVAVPSPGVQESGTNASSGSGGDGDGDANKKKPGPPKMEEDTTEESSDTTTGSDETPSETPLSEAVCVDAELLQDVPSSQLVFSSHRLARVLCDVHGSCGTAGHMVKWDGRTMMMKSYCEEVGCEEVVKHVNSPRYRRGGWVGSRSDGLVFMTLAARYGSRAEELVLRAVMGVGL